MGGSKHGLGLLLLALGGTGLAAPHGAFAQSAFHVTFGTTASPDQRDADNAVFLAETASGDLVVAGSGASYFSDDGQNYVNPLIARFSSAGALR
ncbi:MAG TPA: hypothetical protein VFJ95_06260 [Gammaproteobacteria bacterium]|nr:hypothetical protein [Gammaproteobacteria bacterium]